MVRSCARLKEGHQRRRVLRPPTGLDATSISFTTTFTTFVGISLSPSPRRTEPITESKVVNASHVDAVVRAAERGTVRKSASTSAATFAHRLSLLSLARRACSLC